MIFSDCHQCWKEYHTLIFHCHYNINNPMINKITLTHHNYLFCLQFDLNIALWKELHSTISGYQQKKDCQFQCYLQSNITLHIDYNMFQQQVYQALLKFDLKCLFMIMDVLPELASKSGNYREHRLSSLVQFSFLFILFNSI